MEISEIERFLAQLNDKIDSSIGNKIQEVKTQAVADGNEHKANYLWCLYQIYLVQKNYTDAFLDMKDKKYENAWLKLDRADIELSFLEKHYNNYFGEPIGIRYQLSYILQVIKRFQMLFPYKLFTSREAIIKEEECSICGSKIRLRGGCKHKLGQLYNGEQCCYKVTDFQILAVAIVTDPFDKYALLKIEGQDFNYQVLDFLMEQLESPYQLWNVKKIKVQNPEYNNVGRNDMCPCGSGKKYKKCCMGTLNEKMDHFVFDIPEHSEK
ncbi:MAG: SEC-C domain-containing protein [Lachnospiraceae bacterium]|nr:SEC-C domain-containing protein [Lachnospiraceae bacterium]